MTKHSKTSDKSITIAFQTTKYFHRNTIHIDGVIVKVANRHGVASSLQSNRLGHCIAGGEGGQLTSPTMHAQRRRRNWSRDLASPTAHLNSCTGCSCHCAGMRVLSSAVDSVNMISGISPSSKSTRRCQMLTSLSISPLRSTCASALCCARRNSFELLSN